MTDVAVPWSGTLVWVVLGAYDGYMSLRTIAGTRVGYAMLAVARIVLAVCWSRRLRRPRSDRTRFLWLIVERTTGLPTVDRLTFAGRRPVDW